MYVYILEGLKEEALVSCFILIRVEKKTNKTRKQNKAWIGDFRLIQNEITGKKTNNNIQDLAVKLGSKMKNRMLFYRVCLCDIVTG